MKKDELFIENVIQSELVSQVEQTEKVIDKYFSFTEREKNIALYFMKSSVIDCLGKLFGVIDGVSFLDDLSGNDKVKLLINDKEIQGDLHDIFNEKTESFLNELKNIKNYLNKQ